MMLNKSTLIAAVLLTTMAAASAAHADTLEQRVSRLERLVKSDALIKMSSQLDQLQQQVEDLRGQLEVTQHQLQDMRKRQRSLYLDLDRRLRALETAGKNSSPQQPTSTTGTSANAPSTPGQAAQGSGSIAGGSQQQSNPPPPSAGPSANTTQPPAPSPQSQATQAPPAAGSQTQADAYEQALNLLKAGNYAKAQSAFEAFLKQYPTGQYSDNALYWLGESYYVVRQFDKALPQFQRILDDFPNSGKRPDAMLKIGFIYFEQGKKSESEKTLNAIVKKYPDSSAAALAEQRLKKIRGANP